MGLGLVTALVVCGRDRQENRYMFHFQVPPFIKQQVGNCAEKFRKIKIVATYNVHCKGPDYYKLENTA